MTDISKTIMVGRLVDKPDLVGNNGDVMKFTVAVNRSVKDGETWKSEASYFDWVRFKTSEKFAAIFDKGDMVALSGRARTETVESKKYKDKEGNFHKTKSVVFICDPDGMVPCGSGKNADQPQAEAPKAPAKPQTSAKGPEEWVDDDIPF